MTSAPVSSSSIAPVPGKTLGIVAFVLAFFVNVVGLILGIVALVQSRKAGAGNGWAVAAIIISALSIIVSIILVIVMIGAAAALVSTCADLGAGVHQVNGVTVTCS